MIHRPDTGASYNPLRMIHLQRDDYNDALQYARKGLGIRESTFGIYHPDTASSYHTLGLTLRRMGGDGLAFALEHFQNALAIRESVLGTEHRDTIESYEKVQVVLSDLEVANP